MNEGHDPVLTKVSHDQTSYSVPCRRPLCQCCRGRAYSRLRTVHTGAGELRRWADETRHHVTDRMLPEQLADGRIAFLKAELKITPPRETLWQQVAVAIHENANALDQVITAAWQSRGAMHAIQRIERRQQFARVRADNDARLLAARLRCSKGAAGSPP